MVQWADAVAGSTDRWLVHGPAAHQELFAARGIPYAVEPALNLDTSLRAQSAVDLHRWVSHVLDRGALDDARPIALRLRDAGFPIYVTRDLEAAKDYVLTRFSVEPDRRYGLIASSKAHNLGPYGLDPGFQATKRIQPGAWFNDGPESAASCCRLDTVITEFQCQGLELDLPVVCWGDDFWWEDGRFATRPARRQRLVRDPHQLRTNTYRVLLTRGREGLVVFVPRTPEARMDATAEALVCAGAVRADARWLQAAG